MLRTVLLLDGSEAMNSNSDYLPSYLLAMRPPLLRLVERYLDSTPLASLGIVVMRDGVSHRLLPCTTNRNEIVDVLERDVFLHGGSGAMSLENGLRMAMSELVDMRKVAALAAMRANATKPGAAAPAAAAGSASSATDMRAAWKGSATQLNVLLVSASVTLIDPTDVFNVVNTMAALAVRINVVSLVGAVHVFDVCAAETGGTLHCPLNYDHLLEIVDALAIAHRARATAAAEARRKLRGQQKQRGKRRRSSTGGDADEEEDDEDAPKLIPVGCPIYLTAPPPQQQQQQSATATSPAPAPDGAPSYYLACPQCHLIQLSVPTTCPMCRLLLCSAPMLYSTYVSHNALVPAATRLRVVREADASEKVGGVADAVVKSTEEAPVRCALCMTRIPVDTVSTTVSGVGGSATTSSAAGTTNASLSAKALVWRCSSCDCLRCDACNDFVINTIGMCPQCVSLH